MQYMLVDDGVWTILSSDDLDFGRSPFDVLTSFPEKVCYAIAEYCGFEPPNVAKTHFEKIEDMVTHFLPEIKRIELPSLENQWEEVFYDAQGQRLDHGHVFYDDNVYVEDDGSKNYHITVKWKTEPYYGNIDHQSSGKLTAFLKEEKISLATFLTHKEYWIVVDGDEYNIWKKLKATGAIDQKTIRKEFT